MPTPASRRLAVVLLALAGTTGAATACNAVNGSLDRSLEGTEPSSPSRASGDGAARGEPDADEPGELSEAGLDAGVDAGPVVYDIPLTSFTSPNGAHWVKITEGVVITQVDAGAYALHGMIFPTAGPTIPSSDYTLHAWVRVPTDQEFGLVIRGQTGGDHHVVVWGSRISNESAPSPFLTTMKPPEWEPVAPSTSGRGGVYAFAADTVYHVKVRASNTLVTGKIWADGTLEPPDGAVAGNITDTVASGPLFGFYTLSSTGAVLRKMQVTVP